MHSSITSLPTFVIVALAATTTSAGHLEEVIVTGSHETRTVEVADALVISPDTAQLLKNAPGATVNSNGPLTGIPQYRGMFGPRIAVQLDGTELAPAGPNWMDPPLSYAAGSQLESLQVYRGIAPVSVAQESIGGAINAITENGAFGDSETFQTEAHLIASGQTINQGTQLGLNGFIANRQHRLRIAAMTESGDDADFPDGQIEPTEYDRDRYDVGYGYTRGAHILQLDYLRTETTNSGTPALPMDIGYIEGDLFRIGYTYAQANWTLDGRVFASDLDHDMSNYQLRQAPGSGALWRRNTTDSKNLGFKLLATIKGDHGSWILGADGLDSTHNSDIDNPKNPQFFVTNFNDAQRQVLGVFVERQQEFGADWSAEFGARYNRIEMDADPVDGTPAMMMPPAGMLRDAFNAADRNRVDDNVDLVAKTWFEATDELTWYAGLGRKTRSPSYQERYLWLPLQATGGLADGLTYTGNIELDPEVATEIELGMDFERGGLVMSPRFFYRDVDDYIQGTPHQSGPAPMLVAMLNNNNDTSNPGPLQFNNVDARFWGFDMDWQLTFDANWSLNGLVNYVRGERDDIADNLYRITPLNGTLAVNYRGNNWGASLVGELYDDQDKISATNHERESEGYGLLNIAAFWQLSPELRVAGGVDNLFDKNYQDHLGGVNRVSGNPDIARGERLPGYGTNGFVRIDYRF